MQHVEDKVAFITGGVSGIGLGIARAFAEAGMKLVITYRTESHLAEAMRHLTRFGDRIHPVRLDVSDRQAMSLAAQETLKCFGKIHALINNAGVGVFVPLRTATYDDWDWSLNVNVHGVFNGIHTFLPLIAAHGEGGHVVTISSTAGLAATGGVYSTTKFALMGMMEALRGELWDTNIGVSICCPGLVNTNIEHSTRNRPASLARTGFIPKAENLERAAELVKNTSGGIPGMDPMEVGQLVLRGVRNNDLYILTHPEYESHIRSRHEAIMASIPRDLHPSAERLAIEHELSSDFMYVWERDRRRDEHKPPADE